MELQEVKKVEKKSGSLPDADVKRMGAYLGAVYKNHEKRKEKKRKKEEAEFNLRVFLFLLGLSGGLVLGWKIAAHISLFH